MKMPWEDDIDWGNIATTFGKKNDMVTTDKVTVTEFAPYIGKTTTDYKENDMGVYINKAELLKELSVIQDRPVRSAMQIIKILPTIDLVRCKDCKHYGFKETDRGGFPCCTNVIGATPYKMPTDFCSYGERRDDEN